MISIFLKGGYIKGKDAYIRSLDAWIKQHPTFTINGKDVDTKLFRDFFIYLVGKESTYDPYNVSLGNNGKKGSYSGWYQLLNGANASDLHQAAFDHLSSLLKHNITLKDLLVAKDLGINHSALLMKYWNQGNHSTNYLYTGQDHEDGAGTKISEWGNDAADFIDLSNFVPLAIEDTYILVTDYKSLPDAIARARNPYINYKDKEKSILEFNKLHNKKFNENRLQINDTIFLKPLYGPYNEPIESSSQYNVNTQPKIYWMDYSKSLPQNNLSYFKYLK